MTHIFIDDGQRWLDKVRRCGRYLGEHGEQCGLPEGNRAAHELPDTSEAQAESRRRAGEGEEQ
jgi:hypothetical protein